MPCERNPKLISPSVELYFIFGSRSVDTAAVVLTVNYDINAFTLNSYERGSVQL